MKYIASVSFGKDSLAMLLRLIEEKYPLDIVVFYNTGMEFDCICAIRDKIVPLLNDNGIEFVELHPSEPFMYSMLERKIKYKSKAGYHYGYGWCGGPCRWGTKFKIAAIQKFKKSLNDDVIDYVGIASDEPSRFSKARQEGKVLPLVEWGMKEADCLEYCHKRGYHWMERVSCAGVEYMDLYDILDRVSCWCCSNKNLKELRKIYRHLPQYWSRLEELQSKIERPFKGTYKGEPRGVFELKHRFNLEYEKEESDYSMGELNISSGNKKMGNITSISLPSIVTCRECACQKKCYARKIERLRPNVSAAYKKNLDVLTNDPDTYWREVEAAIMLSRFFRFHVSGDIPDSTYLVRMVGVAQRNKHCQILCFTKKYELVNDYLASGKRFPENLHIILSAWVGLEMQNPHMLPEAHVRYRDGSTTARGDAKQCGGNCAACACTDDGCWTLKSGEQIVFNEH